MCGIGRFIQGMNRSETVQGAVMGLAAIELPFFTDNGFVRKQCVVSGLYFWTRDGDRETCGDTELDEYSFIGNPLIKGFSERGAALKDRMRETFLDFFAQREHSRVEPYPVLARWRDDIHLTIASIADFQPHVTSGEVEPPANPLAISQPCIRLTDVDAVGRSGRHLTTFEMMAHHVFNRPDDGVMYYWMNECVAYCDELLVNALGIDAVEVTYVENPWSGGGNAGAAVEVMVGGLELATLVFMDMEEHPDGDVELKGLNYRRMPLQVIDTGYGLERFCWAAAGTPTIYEAIYPESVEWLKQLAGFSSILDKVDIDLDSMLSEVSRSMGIMNIEIGSDENELRQTLITRLAERGVTVDEQSLRSVLEPLARIYAIPDHMHALCNMLGDGLVPSNSKAGYLARMMARRVLRMRDELGVEISLPELASHHLEFNHDESGMKQTRAGLMHILELEESKYSEMLRKGENIVKGMLKEVPSNASEVSDEILFTLSDTHGMAPALVISVANANGWSELGLRTGFTAEMADRHAAMAKAAALDTVQKRLIAADVNLPQTRQLYYEDVWLDNTQATVLHCQDLDGRYAVVLDQTCFYPEGGGQACDRGQIDAHAVDDVQIEDGVIIHFTSSALEIGSEVTVRIDVERRRQLMDHHTAVHIVGGSARRILGPHVYQAGANKNMEGARLDITHHSRLSRSDLDAIETMSNQVLRQINLAEKEELGRREADLKYGFDLYQGGAPKGSNIRVLKIGEHDIQACGGTHHDDPSRIGSIRLTRSAAVQDGVERLHIVAGMAALEFSRHQAQLLSESSAIFGIDDEDMPRTATRFFEEWKTQRKRIEQLEAENTRLRTQGGGDASIEVDGVRYVILETDGDLRNMVSMVGELTTDTSKPTVAVIGSRDSGGKLLVAITENTIASERHDANELLKAISHHIAGGGGGRPTFAQGGGSKPEGIPAALEQARTELNI